MRLDLYISEKYGFTRNKSQALIDAGFICVNGKVIDKASFSVTWDEIFSIREDKSIHWVSRSAGKLDGFLEEIGFIDITWKNCLDIGSSTGGFTQVLLEKWSSHVDAVDVGTDQLHEKIKNDPRVSSFEKTDIRKFSGTCHPGGTYDIITCDVSFISLAEIIPDILRFLDKNTDIFLLFKPQFEVGRANLRKTGVPKDKKIVEQKLKEFEQLLNHNCLKIKKKSPSTVIWEAGNEEWMIWGKRGV